MDFGLKGKRAIVMAASRGLGYASALGLAREGCQLVDLQPRSGAHRGGGRGDSRRTPAPTCKALAADVSSASEAKRLVDAAVAAYGGLEIVVHNAGGPPAGETLAMTRRAVAEGVRAEPPQLHAHRRRRGAGDEEGRLRPRADDRVLVDQAADSEPGAVERAARRRVGHREDAVARAGAAGHSRQRDRPGPDRHRAHRRARSGQRAEERQADRRCTEGVGWRAFRSDASAGPRSWPTLSCFSRRKRAVTSPVRPSWSMARRGMRFVSWQLTVGSCS